MTKPDIQKRLVNQVFEQIARQYAEQQKAEAAELHNRFVEVIADIRPSSENLLLILQLLQQEALGNLISKFEQIKATPPESKEEVPKEE